MINVNDNKSLKWFGSMLYHNLPDMRSYLTYNRHILINMRDSQKWKDIYRGFRYEAKFSENPQDDIVFEMFENALKDLHLLHAYPIKHYFDSVGREIEAGDTIKHLTGTTHVIIETSDGHDKGISYNHRVYEMIYGYDSAMTRLYELDMNDFTVLSKANNDWKGALGDERTR